jgi:hypothetical protein
LDRIAEFEGVGVYHAGAQAEARSLRHELGRHRRRGATPPVRQALFVQVARARRRSNNVIRVLKYAVGLDVSWYLLRRDRAQQRIIGGERARDGRVADLRFSSRG